MLAVVLCFRGHIKCEVEQALDWTMHTAHGLYDESVSVLAERGGTDGSYDIDPDEEDAFAMNLVLGDDIT